MRTTAPPWLLAVASTALAVIACGAEPAAPPSPRLVVLYVPCTLSTSVLAPYAPAVEYTPEIQAFADGAVVFERHHTESGQSGTAYASIVTGGHAHTHGVYAHPAPLRASVPVISQAFAAAGYETFYWDGQPMAGAQLGYARGVDPENVYPRGGTTWGAISEEMARRQSGNDGAFDAILRELRADPGYTAFVQINFTATHDPFFAYTSPEERAEFVRRFPDEAGGLAPEEVERWIDVFERHWRALQWSHDQAVAEMGLTPEEHDRLVSAVEVSYKAAVAKLDGLFGRFLGRIREAGLLEQSLVAFTADHGQVLHRESAHFQWTHGLQLAPEVLHVPLIVAQPGRLEPGRYPGVTRSIDVFPTLLGLAGLETPALASIQGVDLATALRDGSPAPQLRAYSHTTVLPEQVLRQSAERKELLRFYPRADARLMWVRVREADRAVQHRNLDGRRWGTQVFDLAGDPGLTRDLFDPEDPDHRAARRELLEYKEKLVQGVGRGRTLPGKDLAERLRALGYIE